MSDFIYIYIYIYIYMLRWAGLDNFFFFFNVSLIVRDKVTRQCPQATTFLKTKDSRSGMEPRSWPVGQTGSQNVSAAMSVFKEPRTD